MSAPGAGPDRPRPRLIQGVGAAQSHAEVVAALSAEVPPRYDFVTPLPHVECRSFSTRRMPGVCTATKKGCYVDALSDEVIDVVTTHLPKKVSPLSLVLFYSLAPSRASPMTRRPSAGDAWPLRGLHDWRMPRLRDAACRAGVGPKMAEAFAPLASGGVYVNGVTDFDAASLVEKAYGGGEVRPAGRRQVHLRPALRLPSQRQHRCAMTLPTMGQLTSLPDLEPLLAKGLRLASRFGA